MDSLLSAKTVNNSYNIIPPQTIQITQPKKVVSKTAYAINIMNAIGTTIFETLYQYLAIFLGSAGIIQGLITSIRHLENALLNPLWGRLSDKFGRKRFLIVGNFFLGINAILVPNAPNLYLLFLLIIIQTILNAMVIPTWSGYLGDITSKTIARRGAVLGRIGMITTLLSNFLLVFILFFIDGLDPNRVSMRVLEIPFYIGSITYFLAFALSFKLPTLKDRKTPTKTFPKFDYNKLTFPKPYVRLVILDSLFTIAWSIAWPLFPYVNFSVANTWFEIGLLALFSAIFTAIGQNFSGTLIDKFGKPNLIIFGRFWVILPPLFYIMSIITNNIIFIFISNIVVGLASGATGIVITTHILDNAPEENRSTYQALYLMITGLSAFVGSTIMGILLQVFSGNKIPSNNVLIILFLFASTLRCFTWFGFFFLKESKINKSNVTDLLVP